MEYYSTTEVCSSPAGKARVISFLQVALDRTPKMVGVGLEGLLKKKRGNCMKESKDECATSTGYKSYNWSEMVCLLIFVFRVIQQPVLSIMCAGNELFFSALYVLHFTAGPKGALFFFGWKYFVSSTKFYLTLNCMRLGFLLGKSRWTRNS